MNKVWDHSGFVRKDFMDSSTTVKLMHIVWIHRAIVRGFVLKKCEITYYNLHSL